MKMLFFENNISPCFITMHQLAAGCIIYLDCLSVSIPSSNEISYQFYLDLKKPKNFSFRDAIHLKLTIKDDKHTTTDGDKIAIEGSLHHSYLKTHSY